MNTNVVLYKNFDDLRNELEGDLTLEALNTFITTNAYPTVLPFNDKAI
jgi:hypothetical protein